MDITIKHLTDPAAERCGCLVVPVAEGGKLPALGARLDKHLDGRLARLVNDKRTPSLKVFLSLENEHKENLLDHYDIFKVDKHIVPCPGC